MTREHLQQANPEPANTRRHDLAVIGGGALGCAVAWEAASRGARVLLLERADFGAETSANSLRIAHGGLRYLQKFDLRRARKSVAERAALLRIAPHLVAPLRCAMPTQPALMRGRLAVGAGLLANALLTFDRNRGVDVQRHLGAGGLQSLDAFRRAAPGVRPEGLTGCGYWYDGLIRYPERLCLAFALSARAMGADIRNYVDVTAVSEGDAANIVTLHGRDLRSEAPVRFAARAVADCRGLWHAPFTGAEPPAPNVAAAVCGVNLVLNVPAPASAAGFPARDERGDVISGRLFFAAPIEAVTAVGTWYFEAAPGDTRAQVSEAQLAGILDDVNRATSWDVGTDDILAVQAGLLPADTRAGLAEPTAVDRPEIQEAADRGVPVWRLQTEKWTTVRSLAEFAVSHIADAAGLAVTASKTRQLRLDGARFKNLGELQRDIEDRRGDIASADSGRRLGDLYGSHALTILDAARAEPELAATVPGSNDLTVAEVAHVIAHELPLTLEDLVHRRLGFPRWAPPADDTLAWLAERMDTAAGGREGA